MLGWHKMSLHARTHALTRTLVSSLVHTELSTVPEGRERVGLRRTQKREAGARFPDVGGQPRGHGHLRLLARHRVCVLASGCETLDPLRVRMYECVRVCTSVYVSMFINKCTEPEVCIEMRVWTL